jgi:hypothetical protein
MTDIVPGHRTPGRQTRLYLATFFSRLLAELVETPEWLAESFEAPEPAESVQPPLQDVSVEPSATSKTKQLFLLTAAIYIASALALHLSNAMSISNPVFDLHQFLTDEFVAMSLALAFYSAFPKN